MHRIPRSLLVLLAVAATAVACSTADLPVTPRMHPEGVTPLADKIKATDSLMAVTDIAYSDTAIVLKRTTPLATALADTATIGSSGGTLQIPGAGLRVDIPSGALRTPLTITVTALAGANVTYEFQPHGTLFAKPVKVTQDLRATAANGNEAYLRSVHGSYYDSSLDSAFTDAQHLNAKVKEHQLAYRDGNGSQLRFYIGHFSGYMVGMSLH